MEMVSGSTPANDEDSMRLSMARSYGIFLAAVERRRPMFAHMLVLGFSLMAGGTGVGAALAYSPGQADQDGRIGRFAERGPWPAGARRVPGAPAKDFK